MGNPVPMVGARAARPCCYYVRPVAEMYLRHPRAEASLPAGGLGFGLSYAIIAAGVLVLGILPGPPLAAIAAVARLLS